MAEKFVNGHEAVRMSGFSLTKFTSSKTRRVLEEHGGSFEGKASNWRIPVDALSLLGKPRSRRSAVKVTSGDDIAVLRKSLAEQEARTAELKAQYEDAKKETQKARRALKSAASHIIKQAESEQAELERRRQEAAQRLVEARRLVDAE